MMQHRFLVVGCGSIGRRHIANLQILKAGEILACEPQAERRAEIASRFGIESVESMEAAWDWRPTVALITTPTHAHLDPALAAAKRGCHLFIEKPLADRLEGTEDLLRSVKERNLVSLVGCNLRFHPGLRVVKRLLDDNVPGKVCSARVEVGQYLPDWHPQEDYRRNYSARQAQGGGIILDAIHELDYIRWLLGEVGAVCCFAGRLSRLEIDTEDTAAILLRFRNGAIGEVHMDYVQRAYRRTCQIIGDEGTIVWDYGAGRVSWFTARTGKWTAEEDPPGWEPNRMYVDEMRHFLECLEGRQTSALDCAEARRVLAIALAAKESNQAGRTIEL